MAENVTLKIVEDYHGRVEYAAGQVITVSAETAEWLLADAPGCFELARPVVHIDEIPVPPKDKMVHEAKNK